MRKSFSNLPLSGVKVIDFGQYIAGPAVAMLLGDLAPVTNTTRAAVWKSSVSMRKWSETA